MPRLKGFQFPRKIVAYEVWACHRFTLCTPDVEDLLAERGVIVSGETIRPWEKRFSYDVATSPKPPFETCGSVCLNMLIA